MKIPNSIFKPTEILKKSWRTLARCIPHSLIFLVYFIHVYQLPNNATLNYYHLPFQIPSTYFFLRFDQAKRNPERLKSKPSAQPAQDLLKIFSNIDGKNSEIKYIYLATLFAPTLAFEQRTRTQESKCALVQS